MIEKTICVVDTKTLWPWDYYDDQDIANLKCSELNDKKVLKMEEPTYQVMIYDQFKQLEYKRYITGEVEKITEEEFDEALNVLPPLRWKRDGHIETFCMSEFAINTFTNQYGHFGDQYVKKMIDCSDPSTEIMLEDFKKAE